MYTHLPDHPYLPRRNLELYKESIQSTLGNYADLGKKIYRKNFCCKSRKRNVLSLRLTHSAAYEINQGLVKILKCYL